MCLCSVNSKPYRCAGVKFLQLHPGHPVQPYAAAPANASHISRPHPSAAHQLALLLPFHNLAYIDKKAINMLAIQQPKQQLAKCSPNVLPCRINSNGPFKVTKRFWSPSFEKGELATNITESHSFRYQADFPADKTSTAYFRGRKLRGRIVKLPEGYEGMSCHQPQLLAHTHTASRYHCHVHRPITAQRAYQGQPCDRRRFGLGGAR